jgi:gliding motility-associated-like protein
MLYKILVMNKHIVFLLIILVSALNLSAQLVINEVNQGPGGNPPNEYVEFVVVGTNTCADSCANIQAWILDDNNGFFGTNGIAGGHIRFNTDPQWQCVPYGTIIVIYNAANPYPGIVIDETDANNDNVYFLPSNSSYFQSDLSVPTGGTVSVTYAGSIYSAGGSVWDVLGMSNSNDAFQTVSPTNLTTGYFSISWGSLSGSDISFAGSASSLLFQNENITDNNPYLQTNWASQTENLGTPGAGNSVANIAWINSLQNSLVSVDTILNETICDGDSIFFDNQYLHLLGVYKDTLTAVSGCDSIVTLNLNVEICTNCDMNLGNDTLICGPVNYTLDAGAFDAYLWQDASTNQTFTTNATGQYYCQGSNFDTTNLVVNAGFESGNVNFTTDYTVGTGGAWGLISNAGTYGVSTSPSLVHNNFPFCGDHTSGTGNMMIVNGSNTANQAVWCQTITVNPNSDYYFSIWATSVENTNASNVSSLYFELNGVQIGTNFSPQFAACSWQEYNQTWNSGASITLDLCIYNHTIAGNNDFAIDDIFFGEVCIVSDTINITNTPVSPILDTIDICFNDSTTIFGNIESTTGTYYDTILSVFGCDSLYYQTELVLGDSLFSNRDTVICFSDSAFLQNAWQNTANIYIDTFQNASTCDSLVYTNLIILAPATTDTTTVCSNNPLDVGTAVVDTVLNFLACDSVYNFETTIYIVPNTDTTIVCSNNPLAIGTIVIGTIPNVLTCDSFYNYETTIYTVPATDTMVVCSNNPLDVGTIVIGTIPNVLACDSFYNYETTIYITPAIDTINVNCTNNAALAQTTIDTFRTTLICDSFYAYTLVTYLAPIDIVIIDSCTNIALNALDFTDTLYTAMGCDSVFEHNTVRYIDPDTILLTNICTNDIAQVTTNYLNTTSLHGCDSFTTAQQVVLINPYDSVLDPIEICIGESELIFGINQNQAGEFESPIPSVGGCDSITYVQELIVNPLPNIFAGNDTTIEIEESVILQATGGQTYSWNLGGTNSILDITPEETFNYIVLGTDSNSCSSYDSVRIIVLVPEINIYLPTGFSPNGDGVNDLFRIVNEYDFEEIAISIFNRWGEEIFRSDKNYKAWDGTYKDTPQPIDSYIYKIQATAKKNQQIFNVSGSISLIR